MCGRDSGAQIAGARVSIHQLGLCIRIEQRMVLMLPMHRNEAASELAELCGVGRAAVDLCSPAFAELALEHERRAA